MYGLPPFETFVMCSCLVNLVLAVAATTPWRFEDITFFSGLYVLGEVAHCDMTSLVTCAHFRTYKNAIGQILTLHGRLHYPFYTGDIFLVCCAGFASLIAQLIQ